MKTCHLKRQLKIGSVLFVVLLLALNIIGTVLPAQNKIASAAFAAATCPKVQPSGTYAQVGVCLTEAGKQLTTASGYTVTVTQQIGGKNNVVGTTFADDEFITNSRMSPVGAVLTPCTGNQAIPYQLQITAIKGTAKFTAPVNACGYGQGFLYSQTLAVSATSQGAQTGSVSGCINYLAPDNTTQPLDGAPSADGSAATAVITGPNGLNSQEYTVGFSTNGCLTGAAIASLPVGTYTIFAVYTPGLTPHGLVRALSYQKTFKITAGKNTNVSGRAVSAEPYTGTPSTTGVGVPQTPPITCHSGLNPINWVLCAAVNGMVNIANALDGLINGELSIGTNHDSGTNGTPTEIFGPCTGGATTCAATGYHEAWASFRDIALALLVIVALIVIASTALGLEALDAYTIRKVMPRLVIMAAIISLSWNLLEFFITLTNDLGYGVRYLIYSPFNRLNLALNIGGGTGIAVDLIGAIGITALGTFGLLLFAASAAIAVAGGFIMLILRQVLVTGLIIFSPIALVCYILPNTQKYYSQFASLLGRAVVMGVIFEAVIAFGRVGAALTDQDNSVINQIAAFIMYFGVYYLIFTRGWKWGGAGMAAIGGAVNRSTQGVQGTLSKKRGEVMAKNSAKARAEKRWNPNFGQFTIPITGHQTSIGHIGNRLSANVFNADRLTMSRLGKNLKMPGTQGYGPVMGRGAAKYDEEKANHALQGSVDVLREWEKNGGAHAEARGAIAPQGLANIGGMMSTFDAKTGERRAIQYQNPETGKMEDKSVQQELIDQGFFDKKTNKWKKLSSMQDFQTVGKIMQQSSNDQVREGGHELEGSAHFLSNIQNEKPEWADVDTEAVGMLGLALEGLTNRVVYDSKGEAVTDYSGNTVINTLADQANSFSERVGVSYTSRVVKISQLIGQGLDPSIREGHGIISRTYEINGKPTTVWESSYSKDKLDDRGSVIRKGNYLSDTAVDSVTNMKLQQWLPIRPDSLDRMTDTIKAVATYKGDDQDKLMKAADMRQTIGYMFGYFSTIETDQRLKWKEMADYCGTQGLPVVPLDMPTDGIDVNQLTPHGDPGGGLGAAPGGG
jgi:hypothetical protein